MTNVGKRFTRFTNIYKMRNACASSFGRYIKWLNQWYTMHVKNFNFLLKSIRKNGWIKKNWNSFAAAPSEKQAPSPYWSDSLSRISTIVQPPSINLKMKNRLLSNLKRGRHRNRSIIFYTQSFFAHTTGIYIYYVYYSGSEGHPLKLGLTLETFLEITTTRLLKVNFPSWRLFLKTLPQKCWLQYLGDYTDNTDGTFEQLHWICKLRLYT